jgi:hypothetical protein
MAPIPDWTYEHSSIPGLTPVGLVGPLLYNPSFLLHLIDTFNYTFSHTCPAPSAALSPAAIHLASKKV